MKIPTSTVLTSSQNPSVQGESVTFTAIVSATGAVPAGTVTFKAGNMVLGTGPVPLVGGTASLAVSDLPVGATKITALFRGASFVSTQATLIQTVN